MAGPEKLNGREHTDTPWCWCEPMVFEICEACNWSGEESPGVKCPQCHGANMFRVGGARLAWVRSAFMDCRHPGLVVIHTHVCDDCNGVHIFPRLIPSGDDGEEFDGDDSDTDDAGEPWAKNPDAWKKDR